MGNLINSALQPIGIRPFSGGPYPDAGLGDQAIAATKPLQQAGQGFITGGQDWMNAAQKANPSLWQQWADITGLQNPNVAPTAGKTPGAGAMSPTQQNAFQLSPIHLSNYNNQASVINQARKQAIKNATANQANRLGGNNSSMKALVQQINNNADTHLNDVFNQIVQAAHGEKLNAIGNMFGQNNAQIGQGLSEAGQGGNFIGANVGNLNQQAQAATQRTNQANAALGSFAGAALGGAMGIPKIGGTSAQNAQAAQGAIGGMSGELPGSITMPTPTGTLTTTPNIALQRVINQGANPYPEMGEFGQQPWQWSSGRYPDLTSGAY